MEIESRRFYEAASLRTTDARIRQLLDDLAQEEQRHEATAEEITNAQTTSGALGHDRDAARRLFVLRKLSGRGTPWIRGAVCGLMTALGGLGLKFERIIALPFLVPVRSINHQSPVLAFFRMAHEKQVA